MNFTKVSTRLENFSTVGRLGLSEQEKYFPGLLSSCFTANYIIKHAAIITLLLCSTLEGTTLNKFCEMAWNQIHLNWFCIAFQVSETQSNAAATSL